MLEDTLISHLARNAAGHLGLIVTFRNGTWHGFRRDGHPWSSRAPRPLLYEEEDALVRLWELSLEDAGPVMRYYPHPPRLVGSQYALRALFEDGRLHIFTINDVNPATMTHETLWQPPRRA